MSPEDSCEAVNISKFQAISCGQVVLRLQRSCKAPLVFSHECEVIFLGGFGCEVKGDFERSWMMRGNSFDGTDDFDQVCWPGFVVRGGR